jgi:hypothetical protein
LAFTSPATNAIDAFAGATGGTRFFNASKHSGSASQKM